MQVMLYSEGSNREPVKNSEKERAGFKRSKKMLIGKGKYHLEVRQVKVSVYTAVTLATHTDTTQGNQKIR